jgi:hypothetical protein
MIQGTVPSLPIPYTNNIHDIQTNSAAHSPIFLHTSFFCRPHSSAELNYTRLLSRHNEKTDRIYPPHLHAQRSSRTIPCKSWPIVSEMVRTERIFLGLESLVSWSSSNHIFFFLTKAHPILLNVLNWIILLSWMPLFNRFESSNFFYGSTRTHHLFLPVNGKGLTVDDHKN